jgi:energy-coupling factor transporter ATP-binding protein EcfA2
MRDALLVAMLAVVPLAFAGDEPTFELDPAVQAEVVRVLKEYKPAKRLEALGATAEVDNPGNFGKKVYFESESKFTWLDSGLWGVEGTSRERSGSSAGYGAALSLCGLVRLMDGGGSATRSSSSVFLGSIPFGFTLTMPFQVKTRVTLLDAGATSVCAPVPGASFIVRVNSERDVKTGAPFGFGSRTVQNSETFDCKPADAWKAASEWSGLFTGEALRVDCKVTRKDRSPIEREFFFVRDLGFYFLIAEKEFATHRVSYQRVEYK